MNKESRNEREYGKNGADLLGLMMELKFLHGESLESCMLKR